MGEQRWWIEVQVRCAPVGEALCLCERQQLHAFVRSLESEQAAFGGKCDITDFAFLPKLDALCAAFDVPLAQGPIGV